MKIVNHKTLTSALFALCALMFTVAVSGGCGGGGSGTPSSTQNLVEGFTNEYASPDVTLSDPEEISSDDVVVSSDSNADDDYGDGQFDDFTLLAKTTWNIQLVTVKVNGRTTCQIEGDNSKNTKTVTLITDSARALAWATADDKKTPINDDLTIQFRNPSGTLLTAPILRAGNFSSPSQAIYNASIAARSTVGAGTESIMLASLRPEAKIPDRVTVRNEFSVRGTNYTSTLVLNRVDNFLVLDQTDWKIKDVQVFGFVRDAYGNYTTGNPQNYPIITKEHQNYRITLLTSVKDGRNFLEYRFYPNEGSKRGLTNVLVTAGFRDNTINQQFAAVLLRFGGGFYADGTQAGYSLFKGVLKDSDVPGDEVLRVSDYGPNAEIIIDNSVCYYDKNNEAYHYWVRTTLTPYNPNN